MQRHTMANISKTAKGTNIRPLTAVPATLDPELKADLHLRMTSMLQTTLEIEQVLKLFFQELQKVLSITGMGYSHNGQAFADFQGQEATHSANYRLLTDNEHLGELTFHRSRRFQNSELALLESLLGSLVCPLRNTLMYRDALNAALKDPLTGAGNRVAMDNMLKREMQLFERHNRTFSVMMIDLDRFKSINDRFGHQAGDAVLCQLVRNITHITRETDCLFRYGGEEFMVILDDTDRITASIIAERVRQHVAAMAVAENGTEQEPGNGPTIDVTVSIGVATMVENITIPELMRMADQALYKAKQTGRNQVITADQELERLSV